MISKRKADPLGPVWKALSDPSRRRVLDLLRVKPRTTGQLCQEFPEVSRIAVIKHLAVLERARLITVRSRGRERWNHLNAVPLQRIYERWISPYSVFWASSLLRLERTLQEKEGESTVMAKKAKTPTLEMHSICIEQEIYLDAPPDRVFDALTQEISAWWGAPYYVGDNPKDLILETKLGGRFYEVWSETEGSLWGVVTEMRRPARLELTGAIGMSGAVHGKVGFDLEPKSKGTVLKFSHRAIGEVTEQIRESFIRGWEDLLGVRLKAFVETGKRYGLGHEPPAKHPSMG